MNRLPQLMLFWGIALLANVCDGQDQQRVALLVGVEKYEKRGFSNLSYAEDDMTALAEALKKQGFEVQVLLGSSEGSAKASRANIMATLQQSFLPKLKDLNKSDIALIALAGHGRHAAVKVNDVRSEDHFYCPSDSHDSDYKTWISLSELISTIEQESGCERNLILVDACRDNPSRGRGVDGKGFSLNRDAVAVLFASSYNEQAYEPDELQHGLFTYYVLEGLNGAAKNFDDEVTWDSLVDFVKGRVARKSRELQQQQKIPGVQRPNFIGNLRGESPVLVKRGTAAKVEPASMQMKSAAVNANSPVPQVNTESPETAMLNRTKEAPATATKGVAGIEFVKVSAGTFKMGSDDDGSDKDERPIHHVKISKDFLAGKYEVTIGQVLTWLNAKGVSFDRDWIDLAAVDCPIIRNGDQFKLNTASQFGQSEQQPMVFISWEGAVAFCEWCTRQDVKLNYRLPTEAEWEYLARAGKSYPFPWGHTLNGNEANVNGGIPYGTTTPGPFLESTSKCGSYAPNNWGLYDTSGNVWEWCQDWYEEDYYENSPGIDPKGVTSGTLKTVRGGACFLSASFARSGNRHRSSPDERRFNIGFRVIAE